MRSYTDITPEDRAVIVVTINYYMSGSYVKHRDRLAAILADMFSISPKLSLFDVPPLCLALEDFYRCITNDESKTRLKPMESKAFEELQAGCKSLISRLTFIAECNDLELGRLS